MEVKMFKKAFLYFALYVGTVIFTGCSRANMLYIFNNTGKDFIIESISSGKTLKLQSALVIPVSSGLKIPATFDQGQGWKVSARSGKCKLTYMIPTSLSFNIKYWDKNLQKLNPAQSSYIKLQIEKNYMIYLIPQIEVTIVDVNKVINIQEGEFPIQPTEKSCGEMLK